jgi:hypothetical protein
VAKMVKMMKFALLFSPLVEIFPKVNDEVAVTSPPFYQ